jgi:uncharacterized membrane protein YfcA
VKSSPTSDRVAILLAGACFVHCVAGPVLLSFAGLAGLTAISERFEPAFVVSSLVLGTASLIPSYRHKHRRLICLAMFFGGMLCLSVRSFLHLTVIPFEAIAVGLGACLIIGAHVMNLRLSRQCPCCSSSISTESERPA